MYTYVYIYIRIYIIPKKIKYNNKIRHSQKNKLAKDWHPNIKIINHLSENRGLYSMGE